MSAAPPLRTRARRAVRARRVGASGAGAGAFAATAGRIRGGRAGPRAARYRRALPGRGAGGPRGRGRAGARRGDRARAFPVPVPRRAGLPPRDPARLPAPGGGAGAHRGARPAHDPLPGDRRRRHDDRPRDGGLRADRGARRHRGTAAGSGAARDRARARAAGEPHRRPRRARRRRRLPADRLLLRADPGRFPEPLGRALRLALRTRPRPPGGQRLRPRAGAARAPAGRSRPHLHRRPLRDRAALGELVGDGAVRDDRRGAAGGRPRARPGGAGGAGLGSRPGPAPRSPRRGVPRPAGGGGHGSFRRRPRPRPGALARDGARARLPPRHARGASGGGGAGASGAARAREPRGVARRGVARRDLPRRPHRSRGALRALQDRRPVVPQLERARPGAARRADLRFPALQQELQPVLQRTRPRSDGENRHR